MPKGLKQICTEMGFMRSKLHHVKFVFYFFSICVQKSHCKLIKTFSLDKSCKFTLAFFNESLWVQRKENPPITLSIYAIYMDAKTD